MSDIEAPNELTTPSDINGDPAQGTVVEGKDVDTNSLEYLVAQTMLQVSDKEMIDWSSIHRIKDAHGNKFQVVTATSQAYYDYHQDYVVDFEHLKYMMFDAKAARVKLRLGLFKNEVDLGEEIEDAVNED